MEFAESASDGSDGFGYPFTCAKIAFSIPCLAQNLHLAKAPPYHLFDNFFICGLLTPVLWFSWLRQLNGGKGKTLPQN